MRILHPLFWPALKADVLAALALCRRPRVCYFSFKTILGVFVMLVRGETIAVRPSLYRQRMMACFRCPIYNIKRQTCGTAFGETWTNPITNKVEPIGCLCFLPLKNRLKVNCYLYERTHGEHGWTRELNSYPDDGIGTGPSGAAPGKG